MDFNDLPMLSSTELYQMVAKGDFDALSGSGETAFTSMPIQSTAACSGLATVASNVTTGTLQQEIAQPWIEIIEQPKSRGLRFRYKCEGRLAGSIPGESSTLECKRFPSIKLHNFQGNYFIVVVSCVSKDNPHKPHPHNLVGQDCKRGVCTIKVQDTDVVSFPHLGIQCAKKNEVAQNLNQRCEINVDPYQTGFNFPHKTIDLNSVQLCFQVFLPDKNQKPTKIVPPVSSHVIYDKKSLNELIICRVDRTSGRARGGEEVFLLCEKINRDDVKVRFYREADGTLYWEDFGDFGQNDVHRQFAIVFKTPAYNDIDITSPVEVKMQLYRPSDSEVSEPIAFTYKPEDPDPDRIQDKRKRKSEALRSFFDAPESSSPTVSPEEIKARLKLKARHSQIKQEMKIKQEVGAPAVPACSLSNFGSRGDAAAGLQNVGRMNVVSSDNMTLGNVILNPSVGNFIPISTYNPVFFQQGGALSHGTTSGQSVVATREQLVNNILTNANGVRSNAPVTLSQDIASGTDIIIDDVNMFAAREQNGLPSIDMNMFQAYLEDQRTSVVNIDYDPNIGAMESVGDSGQFGTVLSSSQIEETQQAINELNQST